MATTPTSATPRRQLTREDWVRAAIEVMVGSSVEQVSIQSLAVDLAVSKGSFYHHFESRDDLLSAVLDQWTQTATVGIQLRLDKEEPRPDERLLRFMQLPQRSSNAFRAADLELAILGWARRSPAAARAVERVDRLRIAHIAGLLAQMGVPDDQVQFRAHKAYAFLRYVAQRRDLEPAERTRLTAAAHAELLPAGHAPLEPPGKKAPRGGA